MAAEKYLIWSNEHAAWWAPRGIGYRQIISQAGRYNYETACKICREANLAIPDEKEPNEVMVLAPECARLAIDPFVLPS